MSLIQEVKQMISSCKAEHVCSVCNDSLQGERSEFVDELSFREYKISGMCQKCQDEAFADPDESEDY